MSSYSFIAIAGSALIITSSISAQASTSLRRLQGFGLGANANAGLSGTASLLNGVMSDILSGDSGETPALQRHCADPLSTNCGSDRGNFGYEYDAEETARQRAEFQTAWQDRFGTTEGMPTFGGQANVDAESQAGRPTLFPQPGVQPQPPALFGQSPLWAASTPSSSAEAEGESEKVLTIRQRWQADLGLEVTADPYGIPAPRWEPLSAPRPLFRGSAVSGSGAASSGEHTEVSTPRPTLFNGAAALIQAPGTGASQTGNSTGGLLARLRPQTSTSVEAEADVNASQSSYGGGLLGHLTDSQRSRAEALAGASASASILPPANAN